MLRELFCLNLTQHAAWMQTEANQEVTQKWLISKLLSTKKLCVARNRPIGGTPTGRTSSRSESCSFGSQARTKAGTGKDPDQQQQKAKMDDSPVALYPDDSGQFTATKPCTCPRTKATKRPLSEINGKIMCVIWLRWPPANICSKP